MVASRNLNLLEFVMPVKPKTAPVTTNLKNAEAIGTKEKPSLTKKQIKVLTVLSLTASPMNRKQLFEKTGMKKGWSKLLGASTKDGYGTFGGDSLEGRKLVKSQKIEETIGLHYIITSAGKKALEKSSK